MKGILGPIDVHPYRVPQDVGDPTASPRYGVKRFAGGRFIYVTDRHINVALKRYDLWKSGDDERARSHARQLNDEAEKRAARGAQPPPAPVELTVIVERVMYVRRTTFWRTQSGGIASNHSYFVGPQRVRITEHFSWHDIQRIEAAIQMLSKEVA